MTNPPQRPSLEGWTKLQQRGNPSSHWTIALGSHGYLLTLFGLTIFHFLLSVHLPLTPDELYYWSWAQDLQLSYYDHPPFVAILIKISCGIFGDNSFGIRFFPSVLCFAILWMVGRIVDQFRLLFLVLGIPIVSVLSIIMTPDVPLLFFWTCYLLWTISVNENYREWTSNPVSRVYHKMPAHIAMWAFGGVILGLGLLSKYTMALAVPSLVLLFGVKYRFRSWVLGLSVHYLVAAIVASPILFFNAQHEWMPLLFQWSHGSSPSQLSHGLIDFLGGQILLVGALPFLLLPWLIIQWRKLEYYPSLLVCAHFFTVPILIISVIALRSRVEGNWALMAYLSFWPIGQWVLQRNSLRLLGYILIIAGFGIPWVVTLLILIHSIVPLKWIPPHRDRLWLLREKTTLAQTIANDVGSILGGRKLLLPTYQWTSYFRYLRVPSDQMYPAGRRSNFTLAANHICENQTALVLEEQSYREPATECFGEREVLKTYPLNVRGTLLHQLSLVEYRKKDPIQEP